jgi:hypothetical protein
MNTVKVIAGGSATSIALLCLLLLPIAAVRAQAPKEPTSAEILQELGALRLQLQGLQQQAQRTPQEQAAQASAFYEETFATNKRLAQEACKKAKGRLWVMVTQGPTTTVSVSCEMR